MRGCFGRVAVELVVGEVVETERWREQRIKMKQNTMRASGRSKRRRWMK
jgi:hypothetical protein